jgi:hypothetical protein
MSNDCECRLKQLLLLAGLAQVAVPVRAHEQAEGFECTLVPMAAMARIAAAVDKRTNKERRDAERAAAVHCKSQFKAANGASKKNDSKRPMVYSALQMTCCKHNGFPEAKSTHTCLRPISKRSPEFAT